jgi:hypothetical protein
MATKVQVIHYAEVLEDGKTIIYSNPSLRDAQIQQLAGKKIEIEYRKQRKSISKDTFGYYWGGIVPTALEFEMFGGWSDKRFDLYFRGKYLSYTELFIVNGVKEEKVYVKDLKDLSQEEMNIYITQVVQWLAENGIVILDPKQYKLQQYKTVIKNGK